MKNVKKISKKDVEKLSNVMRLKMTTLSNGKIMFEPPNLKRLATMKTKMPAKTTIVDSAKLNNNKLGPNKPKRKSSAI